MKCNAFQFNLINVAAWMQLLYNSLIHAINAMQWNCICYCSESMKIESINQFEYSNCFMFGLLAAVLQLNDCIELQSFNDQQLAAMQFTAAVN